MEIKVNGKVYSIAADPETPLLWVLRDHLGLTGTKYSCGIGECGACTVLLNGEPALSCQTSLAEAAGREVTTIEGLSGPVAERVKRAWLAEQVPQCGFCQPGQIITATALLRKNPRPGDGEIDEVMSAVLCRCGTYPDIRRAIHRAAKEE
jgi:aerobic-type carbon monoxide dehydrogenase small subunit (CoxS/CutS family)